MKSTSYKKTSKEDLHSFNEEEIFEFAKGLDRGNYSTSFNVLKNWDLNKELVNKRTELAFGYINLLD